MYLDGANWWPDRAFEREHIVPEQEGRYEPDAWQEAIAEYLATRTKVKIGEVAEGALHFVRARLGTADQHRITAIMELLGWHRLPKDRTGNRYWAR